MARHIAAEGLELFRAVVTSTVTTERDGNLTVSTYTSYFGPYNNIGTAKAQVTREGRYDLTLEESKRRYPMAAQHRAKQTVGFVEQAEVTWRSADAPPSEPLVSIRPDRLERLKADSEFLARLRAAGVDN